jgi:YbgC/YbaW family acyl-CoA thioester hydrolase
MSAPTPPPVPGRTRFETEMQVRPDDLDMMQHVHASRYLDYVLAARCDQMARCYGMAMEEFLARGLGWYTRVSHFEYHRPLRFGERFVVRTWIEEFFKDGVRVEFEILKADQRQALGLGLVSLHAGQPPDRPGRAPAAGNRGQVRHLTGPARPRATRRRRARVG